MMPAYSEVSQIDVITVLPDGQIQVRRCDLVLRDGEEISRKYHRHVLDHSADLTDEDPKVVAVAKAIWPMIKKEIVAEPKKEEVANDE